MARVWALADLHLSSSGEKPMDVFGEDWVGHADRIAAAWDRLIARDDLVLLPGDLSWARNLTEARGDLEWIGSRPGSKILLRGNHDSWWSSLARVRASLPESCLALQNDAVRWHDRVFVGARGWTDPADPLASPHDVLIFRRELERLKLSVADADRRFGPGRNRVALVHFPPWIRGRPPTAVVEVMLEAGVTDCVYGHLHGADHALGVIGTQEGIRYHLVSVDAIGFEPVPITEADGAGASA